MGLLIGGRLDDEEETGDVGYVCRYLLTDWGRRERVARCCERCRRSEGSHRRSGWRGSGGGSATGLGGREIVGVRCRVRVRWRQARWCGVYNRLGRHRGVESRRGGGSGSGRSGWRRWAGLPGSSRWAVVAAAVDRWWVSAGRLVGLAGRPPFAGRGASRCAGVAMRVCLLGPGMAAGGPGIPVLGAGAMAVVVGCTSVARVPPPSAWRVIAGGEGGPARAWLRRRSLLRD